MTVPHIQRHSGSSKLWSVKCVKSKECPKYCVCHAKLCSTHAGCAPNAAPATQKETLTISHACHGICTLSPLDAALTTVQNTQHDTSKVQRLPCKIKMDTSKVLHKNEVIFWRRCSCHTKPLSTLHQTQENVTKCHACHAKRQHNLFWNLPEWEVLQLAP